MSSTSKGLSVTSSHHNLRLLSISPRRSRCCRHCRGLSSQGPPAQQHAQPSTKRSYAKTKQDEHRYDIQPKEAQIVAGSLRLIIGSDQQRDTDAQPGGYSTADGQSE